MKVVILCGGKGFRMHQLTEDIPKPLVDIDGRPMLWHIMKTYKYFGFDDFVLLLGYKGDRIKEYFINDKWKSNSFYLNTETGGMEVLDKKEEWKITFLDTGADTMTGGRLKQAQKLLHNETFMMTYGDGLSDIDLHQLLAFHQGKGKVATVTGIEKTSQYGTLTVTDGLVTKFNEKNQFIGTINGGFFVLEPEIFNYLPNDDQCVFEKEPMLGLVANKELAVYLHNGFWRASDTLSDIIEVNNLCKQGKDKWRVW